MHDTAAACSVAPTSKSAEGAPAQLPDFDTLYDDYADFVWRNARRLGVSEAAIDDVVQDVFVVLYRRLADFNCPPLLRAWVLSIVIRVVRGHRRTLRRKDPHLRSAMETLDPDSLPDLDSNTPLANAEQTDAVRLMQRVLGELDDPKREVFVLAELEELTGPEIAAALGENLNTVHSRLRAAKRDFEQALQRHYTRDEWRLR